MCALNRVKKWLNSATKCALYERLKLAVLLLRLFSVINMPENESSATLVSGSSQRADVKQQEEDDWSWQRRQGLGQGWRQASP